MLTKKNMVGYLQVILGLILILGIFLNYNNLLADARDKQQGNDGLSGWMEFAQEKNISFTPSEDFMLNLDVYSNNVNTLYTLRCTLAVIIVLSVMMIMQGLANIFSTSIKLVHDKRDRNSKSFDQK